MADRNAMAPRVNQNFLFGLKGGKLIFTRKFRGDHKVALFSLFHSDIPQQAILEIQMVCLSCFLGKYLNKYLSVNRADLFLNWSWLGLCIVFGEGFLGVLEGCSVSRTELCREKK